MKIRSLALIAALALPAIAAADNTTKTPAAAATALSAGDTKIVAHVHHVNLMEIDLGKAAQKSNTAGVKSYGESLVKDHTQADKDLTTFAKAHKLAMIPMDKPMTDAEKQEEKDMAAQVTKLKTLKGAEFDKMFLDMMASGHDKELAKIDAAMGSVENGDLKVMLTAIKPVLQKHADSARDLQKAAPQAMK